MKYAILLLAALAAVAYSAPVEVETATQVQGGLRDQLVKSLQEHLEETMRKIRRRVDFHHQNAKDLIDKAKEYADRLKQLRADVGDKVQDLIKNFQERASQRTKSVWDRIRSLFVTPLQGAPREKRQIGQAFREFIENFRKTVQGHFADFSEWLKGHWTKAIEHATNQRERWTAIAREIRDHASEMSKETAREAREALEPHRQELGGLYNEVMEKLKNVILGRGN